MNDREILLIAGILAVILGVIQVIRANAAGATVERQDLTTWGVIVLGVGVTWAAWTA